MTKPFDKVMTGLGDAHAYLNGTRERGAGKAGRSALLKKTSDGLFPLQPKRLLKCPQCLTLVESVPKLSAGHNDKKS